MKKIAILFNPGAARGRAAAKKDSFQATLRARGLGWDFFESKSEAHLGQLTRELAEEYKVIVCVGGDTTVHLVVNELMQLPRRPLLGIVGLGSSNDIARHLGVRGAERLARVFPSASPREVDVGCIVVGGEVKRYFLGQLSLGLGVLVNRFVDEQSRKYPFLARATPLVGFWGIVAAYRQKKVPFSLQVEGPNLSFSGASVLTVVSNTRYWASGCLVNPGGRIDDGRLEVSIFHEVGLPGLARLYRLIRRGKHLQSQKVTYASGDVWRISSPSPLRIQVDGEVLFDAFSKEEVKELEIRVLRRALLVLMFGD